MKQEILKMWSNAKANRLHLILAVVMLLMGLVLLVNDNFFYWPPEWSMILNNDLIDTISIITGVGLFAFVLTGGTSKIADAILLSSSAFFITMFLVLEVGHALFMRDYGRLVFSVPALGMLLEIQYLANRTKHRK